MGNVFPSRDPIPSESDPPIADEGEMQRDLVIRAARGEEAAFAALAEASIDRCHALAYRILRDHHAAQDATQQALLGAWRDLPTLRDPDRFDPWLHRLVVHACYGLARSERRWQGRVRLISDQPVTTPDAARALAIRDELEQAFGQLTPEHRAVVVLHHYLGYQLTEIAEVLGLPSATVRSRLLRAMRRLREAVEATQTLHAEPGERTA